MPALGTLVVNFQPLGPAILVVAVLTREHDDFIFRCELLDTNAALFFLDPFVSPAHPDKFFDEFGFSPVLDAPEVSLEALGHSLGHLLLFKVQAVE